MTIDEIRDYAKERCFSQKKIDELISELHPDENGKLSPIESLQACNTINYIADTRENIKTLLKAGRAMRNKAKNKK